MQNHLLSEKIYKSCLKPTVEHTFYSLGFLLIVYLSYDQENIVKSALTPIFISCLLFSWLLAADSYLIISLKYKPNIFFYINAIIFLSLCSVSVYLYGLVGLTISFTGFVFALIYSVFAFGKKRIIK